MKILHLSDLHLTKEGQEIWETDTFAHFNKTIDLIKSIDNVDVIVVTGDLSNDGSEWTYKYIDHAFESLSIPTLCCPGNHDSMSMMLKDYIPSFYKVNQKVVIGGYKFLMLNSVIHDDEDPNTNKSRGLLSQETLKYVEEEINDGLPTIIAFHHPPLEPGGWLNRKLLDNRDEFNNLIHDADNVKLVLYGHIHYPTQNSINGTMYVSAPSIGFAFDKDLPKFQIAQNHEGFNIINVSDGEIEIEKILLY